MPNRFPPEVTAAAVETCRRTGIPASVTLAQWACESAYGAHMSGKNNPFGIKAKPPAPCTSCMTREVVDGHVIHVAQFFADYVDMTDAFDAHARLLATAKPYARARALLPDAEKFAHALTGVYATDPHYGDTLVSIMRTNNLQQYDTAARLIASVAPAAVPKPQVVEAVRSDSPLVVPETIPVMTPADLKPGVQLTANPRPGFWSWLVSLFSGKKGA